MQITWQGNPDLGLPRTEHSAFTQSKTEVLSKLGFFFSSPTIAACTWD